MWTVRWLEGADAADEVFAGSDAEFVEDVPEVEFDGFNADVSSAAVCRLEWPAATRRATACSAGVRPGRAGRARLRRARQRLEDLFQGMQA